MNKELKKSHRLIVFYLLTVLTLTQMACKKLVAVDAPTTSTNASIVYANDVTATAVLTNVYTKMNQNGTAAMSLYPGLSADELTLFSGLANIDLSSYYTNSLSASIAGPNFWTNNYSIIFICNAAVEGITASSTLTPAVQKQLLGEAKFMRAFCYFYLINLYGDVPLNLTTDYKANAIRPRTDKGKVYEQIISDLKEAKDLLGPEYINASFSTTDERVRPNKYAAMALLSRVYLYIGDDVNAESQASAVITNHSVYDTVGVDNVFLKNSKEAIWALQPVDNGLASNTEEGRKFILTAEGPSGNTPVYLSAGLLSDFSVNDKRLTHWIKSVTVNSTTYNYVYKYKIGFVDVAPSEYSVVLRLAEQYLIRSEARAHQGNLNGSVSDLNVIRKRAGLDPLTASDRESLLSAILKERRLELFTEWGHRWFDLKRTGNADRVLQPVKGSNWQSTDQLYPIPQKEMDQNPGIKGHQNLGY